MKSRDRTTRILRQLLDALETRIPLIGMGRAAHMSAKLLTWAMLSVDDKIDESLKLTASLVNRPDDALAVFEKLGKSDSPALARIFEPTREIGLLDTSLLSLLNRYMQQGQLVDLDLADLAWPSQLLARADGDFALPPAVADLFLALAEIEPGQSVYCPWDGDGQLPARVAASDASAHIEVWVNSPYPWIQAALSPELCIAAQGDPLRDPAFVERGELRTFDAALCFPPMGLKVDRSATQGDIFGRFPDRTTSGEVLHLRHLISQVKGRIVVGVFNGALFKTGVERDLREELVEKGMLEAVVSLRGSQLPNTLIPFSILVLNTARRNETVRFVDASDNRFYDQPTRTRFELRDAAPIAELRFMPVADNLRCVDVPVSAILKKDCDWTVSSYVLSQKQHQVVEQLNSSETLRLGGLVKIIRPLPRKKVPMGGAVAREFRVADLPAFGFSNSPGESVDVEPDQVERGVEQLLREGDILISTKGTTGAVGLVGDNAPRPGETPWICGQTMLILRVTDDRVDARTLFMQLRSPFGQAQLEAMVTGTAISAINLKQLREFQVLVPAPDLIERAKKAFEEEVRLQKEIERLAARQRALTEDLWTL